MYASSSSYYANIASRNDAAVEKAKSFSDTHKIKAVSYQVDGKTVVSIMRIHLRR